MDCLFGGSCPDKDKLVSIGVHQFSVFLENESISTIFAGMNDETADFDTIFKNVGEWKTSCKFEPKLLSEAIKPLYSFIPNKDKYGTIIVASITQQKMSLSAIHKDVGQGDKEVKGITEIYNENSIKCMTLNMHPQAFYEFTNLFSVEEARMYANSNTIYYDGSIKLNSGPIKIKYLFPTVQV